MNGGVTKYKVLQIGHHREDNHDNQDMQTSA